MPEEKERRKVGQFERHGQSVVAGLILLSLAWVGATLNAQVTANAVLTEKLEQLETKFASMELQLIARMDDRYRGSDARRDFAAVWTEIERLRANDERFGSEQNRRGPRIKSLEETVKELVRDHKRENK